MTYTIPSVFTAIDKFSAPINKMTSKVEAFAARSQRSLSVANASFNSLLSPLGKLKNMLGEIGLYVGLYQLIRVFRSAYNTIADFEQANVNLASVTEKQSLPYLKALSDQARDMAVKFGIAAKSVTELQYELTKKGFQGDQILNMTPSISLGAKAFRAEAADVADVVGGVLKAYEYASTEAGNVVNKILYVANATSADFESMQTQLPIIARVAKIAGVSFSTVLASLGVLRDVQIHTATGSTSFKNFLLDAVVKQGKTYQQAIADLQKADKNGKLLQMSFVKYGKKTVVTAVEFARQLEKIQQLSQQADMLPSNYTELLAAKQLDTLNGRLSLVKTAWQELILAIDQGNGPIGKSLKGFFDVTRALLLLNTDSVQARDALRAMDSQTLKTARRLDFLLQILLDIIIAMALLKIALLAWGAGATLFAAGAGIMTFAADLFAVSIWAVNTAIATGLLGSLALLSATGIGILLVLAAASETVGNNWNNMIAAFKNGNIIEGVFRGIALAIDLVLYPMQKLSEYLHRILGMQDPGTFKQWRAAIGLETEVTTQFANGNPALNERIPQNERQAERINPKASQFTFGGQVDLTVYDKGGNVESVKSDTTSIVPFISRTAKPY